MHAISCQYFLFFFVYVCVCVFVIYGFYAWNKDMSIYVCTYVKKVSKKIRIFIQFRYHGNKACDRNSVLFAGDNMGLND